MIIIYNVINVIIQWCVIIYSLTYMYILGSIYIYTLTRNGWASSWWITFKSTRSIMAVPRVVNNHNNQNPIWKRFNGLQWHLLRESLILSLPIRSFTALLWHVKFSLPCWINRGCRHCLANFIHSIWILEPFWRKLLRIEANMEHLYLRSRDVGNRFREHLRLRKLGFAGKKGYPKTQGFIIIFLIKIPILRDTPFLDHHLLGGIQVN